MTPATSAPGLLAGTEAARAEYEGIDGAPTLDALATLLASQIEAAHAVEAALPRLAAAVEAAATRLGGAGRLIYIGAGTSGRLGALDAAELFPTFRWPRERVMHLLAGGDAALTAAIEGAEDSAEGGERAVDGAGIGGADVVIGLAASGTTPFTVASLARARRRGALTIGVASVAGSPLLAAAEHPILVETGAEAVAGSTRLKAGTAQKIVLNLLSTGVMIRLGRVWRGRMVEVVATNAKLRDRAIRMVEELGAVPRDRAEAALEGAGWHVKTALVMLRGHSRASAERLLEAKGGRLGEILDGSRDEVSNRV